MSEANTVGQAACSQRLAIAAIKPCPNPACPNPDCTATKVLIPLGSNSIQCCLCGTRGPDNDPTGERWNALPRAGEFAPNLRVYRVEYRVPKAGEYTLHIDGRSIYSVAALSQNPKPCDVLVLVHPIAPPARVPWPEKYRRFTEFEVYDNSVPGQPFFVVRVCHPSADLGYLVLGRHQEPPDGLGPGTYFRMKDESGKEWAVRMNPK